MELRVKLKPLMGSILACWLFLAGGAGVVAEEQSKFDLAPGYYIFLGTQPGRIAPRAFTISSTGSIFWQDNTAAATEDRLPGLDTTLPQKTVRSTRQSSSSQATSDQYESINYPIIKWRPKPISSIAGAFVQLSTTYEQNALKYKITLFKAKAVQASAKLPVTVPLPSIKEISPSGFPTVPIDVQLLDQNGFKLLQFTISQNQWDLIPGTNVLEARDQLSCNEWDYKRSRDYTVK